MNKTCPMKFGDNLLAECIEGKCEWFDDIHERCYLVSLVRAEESINKKLETIIKLLGKRL